MNHRHVQNLAKTVLTELGPTLGPDSTERSIADTCVDLLRKQGVTQTWYYDCPAFVLLGSRSCLSISGRDYQPADERVGQFNLVTVDLSPLLGGVWGDCARSFVVENGRWAAQPVQPEFVRGMEAQRRLHQEYLSWVSADRTFDEVFRYFNDSIVRLGFENLDFLGNLGHSIVTRREDRVFFEAGNQTRVGDVELFTFEPHLRERGGRWGFKHENIYRFNGQGRVIDVTAIEFRGEGL